MRDLRINKNVPRGVSRDQVLSDYNVGDNYRYFSRTTGALKESLIRHIYAPSYSYSVFITLVDNHEVELNA